MANNPELRASDDDRDRTAALLREHLAQGRLTAEEFGERLDKTFTAKTAGELELQLRDLPRIDLYRLPDAKGTRLPNQARPRPAGRMPAGWRVTWTFYATVNILCFVVWLLSSPGGYPWFLWVAGPWGVVLGGAYAASEIGRSHRPLPKGPGPGELPTGHDPQGGAPG